jgi:hypothetical protein
VYNKRPGIISKISNYIPAPLKSFIVVAATAAGVLFIATPLLIIVTPPVVLGLWWYTRRIRNIQNELYNQRWSNMGSYHLAFEPDDVAAAPNSRIPSKARSRILRALENNENGVASGIGIDEYDPDELSHLKFTDVESIVQDFKGSSQGFKEDMEITTYGLISEDTNNRLADIALVVHRNLVTKKAQMRIEISTLGSYNRPPRTFVLEGSESDDDEDMVIEVKSKNTETKRF